MVLTPAQPTGRPGEANAFDQTAEGGGFAVVRKKLRVRIGITQTPRMLIYVHDKVFFPARLQ